MLLCSRLDERATISLRRLIAIVQTVVTDHGGDAEPIVAEQVLASPRLRRPMRLGVAPRGDGLLVAEDRERQNLLRVAQALEAFDRHEAVNRLETAAERRRNVQVGLPALGARP